MIQTVTSLGQHNTLLSSRDISDHCRLFTLKLRFLSQAVNRILLSFLIIFKNRTLKFKAAISALPLYKERTHLLASLPFKIHKSICFATPSVSLKYTGIEEKDQLYRHQQVTILLLFPLRKLQVIFILQIFIGLKAIF